MVMLWKVASFMEVVVDGLLEKFLSYIPSVCSYLAGMPHYSLIVLPA
jgi:hypothetical protein